MKLSATVSAFIVGSILASSLGLPVLGGLSNSTTISISGQIVSSNLQSKKYVATLLITWNEYYFGQDPNWGNDGLFTPTLGSYIDDDVSPANMTAVNQQIIWMQQAGINICFITVDYNQADLITMFMNAATALNSTVEFAVYFNGSNFDNSTGNLALTGIQTMWNAGIFTNPQYFKYNGKPVVSGYLPNPNDGYNCTYWVDVHNQYPSLSIWADGWHPNYWNSLNGVVDAMVVMDFSQNATEQVNYYLAAEKHPLRIHVFPITAGFDDSAINGTLPKLNRNSGQTFIDCWNKISTLATAPDVVWVCAWNEYGECSGIEPISASRSTTTGAFGDLYLNLTREYGNLFKSG